MDTISAKYAAYALIGHLAVVEATEAHATGEAYTRVYTEAARDELKKLIAAMDAPRREAELT